MAVPASGSLSLAAIAAEKIEDDYTDVDTTYGPYSLKDITVGGNASGVDGETYDVTNGFSPSHPDNIAGYGMGEFYSYDHDYAAPACNIAYQTGGQGTFDFPITLGTSTGTVTIEYQAYSFPDKFEFTWNGNSYTSGDGNGTGNSFVGHSGYASNSAVQPLDTLTADYGTGSGQTQTGGRGTITFNKNTSSSASNMRVTAPLGGTGWWFSVSCPGNQVVGGGDGIAPTVITDSEDSIGSTGFTMKGGVTSLGLASNFTSPGTVSSRGFVYKTGNTTDQFVDGQTGVTKSQADTNNSTGSFSVALTGLSSSTDYTYRAYASNQAGTTYGANEVATTTSSATAPSVTTNNASSITSSTMQLNGNLTSTGGATVTAKGFVYSSLISNPTLGATGVQSVTASNPNTTGAYNATISSLQSSTTHYIKAYATNSQGTSYGSVMSAATTTSYNTRYVTGPFSKSLFACGQEINQVIKFTGSFGNGSVLYDNSLNLMNDTNGGNKWYGGPPNASSGAANASGFFFVNGFGVVSGYQLESC
jgi:hypothetical protein